MERGESILSSLINLVLSSQATYSLLQFSPERLVLTDQPLFLLTNNTKYDILFLARSFKKYFWAQCPEVLYPNVRWRGLRLSSEQDRTSSYSVSILSFVTLSMAY